MVRCRHVRRVCRRRRRRRVAGGAVDVTVINIHRIGRLAVETKASGQTLLALSECRGQPRCVSHHAVVAHAEATFRIGKAEGPAMQIVLQHFPTGDGFQFLQVHDSLSEAP